MVLLDEGRDRPRLCFVVAAVRVRVGHQEKGLRARRLQQKQAEDSKMREAVRRGWLWGKVTAGT